MTDSIRPGDLDATSPRASPWRSSLTWVYSAGCSGVRKLVQRFCAHEAAIVSASLADAGELASGHHKIAVALLTQWTPRYQNLGAALG